MRRRSSLLVVTTLILAAGTQAEGPRSSEGGRPASLLVVSPGQIVRWPGNGIEACGAGPKVWPMLQEACFFPVDLQHAPGPFVLRRQVGGRTETATITVSRNRYPIQRLTLPPSLVNLSKADLERVRRENREVAQLWGRTGPRRFTLPLTRPLENLPPGGRFGARRIINGLVRSPHGGADYGAAEGTRVRAAADGVVALVADHFFSGRSVFLDHGDGLVSMYFHLSRVDIEVGREVQDGDVVGAVGATGRAKGAHLHFGVRWRSARVDPALLFGDPLAMPTLAACGESHTAARTAVFRHLFVAEPRNIPDIPSVRRLDLTENLSSWSAEHFLHRLLAD